jgi:hypothetical protein
MIQENSTIIDLVITIIKTPAILLTGFVARMGLEPMCARGAYESCAHCLNKKTCHFIDRLCSENGT